MLEADVLTVGWGGVGWGGGGGDNVQVLKGHYVNFLWVFALFFQKDLTKWVKNNLHMMSRTHTHAHTHFPHVLVHW